MARAAVGIRIPVGIQNAENGVVWGGLKRYFRLIKNPHRIPMGLWGWKIIPIPTPYPYPWDPYGDLHTHGSPGVWVWQWTTILEVLRLQSPHRSKFFARFCRIFFVLHLYVA